MWQGVRYNSDKSARELEATWLQLAEKIELLLFLARFSVAGAFPVSATCGSSVLKSPIRVHSVGVLGDPMKMR